MYRKHNPFVSLVALLLAAIILVLTCTGCRTEAEAEAAERDEPAAVITEGTETAETEPVYFTRFEIERELGPTWNVNGIYVITDRQTGVQYLYVKADGGGGLTALLPGEG